MHFETFALGNSPIHKLDPRTRLLGALILSAVFALLQTLPSALFALGAGLLLVFSAQLPLRPLLLRLAGVNLFIFFLWLVLPFSFQENAGGLGAKLDVLFRIGPFNATWQGVNLALLITLKSNAIILVNLALLASMRVLSLAYAMQALKVPSKLVQILFFSLRYFQVIHQEYHRLHQAMRARGFRPKTNWHTYRTYGYLLSMLLVRSLNRGQRVYEAMLCRGFNGQIKTLQHFPAPSALPKANLFFMILTVFTSILAVVVQCKI